MGLPHGLFDGLDRFLNRCSEPRPRLRPPAVVPILMQGMQQLVKDRPEDPIEWIADFLKKNNPKKRKAAELAA